MVKAILLALYNIMLYYYIILSYQNPFSPYTSSPYKIMLCTVFLSHCGMVNLYENIASIRDINITGKYTSITTRCQRIILHTWQNKIVS